VNIVLMLNLITPEF